MGLLLLTLSNGVRQLGTRRDVGRGQFVTRGSDRIQVGLHKSGFIFAIHNTFLKIQEFLHPNNDYISQSLQSGLSVILFLKCNQKMAQHPSGIQIHKVLSTSLTCKKNTCPQWVSDTQLNYLSQFDFITYDLDEDKLELIEKPFHHQVIAVRYLPLIGHRSVRIVYLYKDEQLGSFNFVVLPSLSFSDDYSVKRVQVPNRSVSWIQNFVYFSDGHYVLFSALFQDNSIGLVCMSLTNNNHLQCQVSGPTHDTLTDVNNFIYFPDEMSPSEGIEKTEIRNSSIMVTKEQNLFIFMLKDTLYLIKLSIGTSQLKILSKIYVEDLEPATEAECSTILLTKTYIIIKKSRQILLYYIEDDRIRFGSAYNATKNIEDNVINCMTCSTHNNKIVVSVDGPPILFQYRVNDITDRIEYINCISLETEHTHISKIITSDTGRNVAIFTFAPIEAKPKGKMKAFKGEEVINFSIFKIELFTELGMPDSSLCLKETKFKNRNKRVNRLVIPKIYQKIYSLTGSEVHTLEAHRLSGVLFFDIHPFGFYMAISFSFNVKIYSIEANSMTLLYSMTLQNLKKILYSPDGSNMVLVSPRLIKVLDAFSFELKYEIVQKNSNIVDIAFGPKRNTLLILHENGVVAERNFYDFDKVKIYRIYGHTHRRILTVKMDQKNENLYCLIEDGSIIVKPTNNLTVAEVYLAYEDEQKISEFYIDAKNSLIFFGTKNGILRVHSIYGQKFLINEYTQVNVTEYEISAITCSYLQNFVYVGNIVGDITMLKYNPYSEGTFLAKSSKILKNIAPKVAPYFSFDFQLISFTKFQGNSEQNVLEDKLENLIEKMQNHTTNYKNSMIQSYQRRERECNNKDDEEGKNTFRDYDGKSKKLKMDIHYLRQKHVNNKKELSEQYDENIKNLFSDQERLQSKKKEVIENWEKMRRLQEIKIKEEERITEKEYEENLEKFELFYKKEKYSATLVDLDNDYRITDTNILNTLNLKLQQELKSIKAKCLELNKSNSYLETAKINIQSRKIQEETLEHRINQQLKVLKEVNLKQNQKIAVLGKELRSTQDLIHHIQNKVKNTPNNVISTDKADSDLCSYKIWMKDKVQEELSQLEEYLNGLEDNFEAKSLEIVEITDRIRSIEENYLKMKKKEEVLKQKLKSLRYQLVVLENNGINVEKNIHPSLLSVLKCKINQSECYFDDDKTKRIVSLEKLNEKALYFENKNLKIHTRKIRNLNTNNAELIHQYEKLKYENKWLLDKQIEHQRELTNVKQAIFEKEKRRSAVRGANSERTSLHKQRETPFVKYVNLKACRTKRNLNYLLDTATSASTRAKTTMRSAATSRVY